MSVTYSPTSRACVRALPSFRGAVVTARDLELHQSCEGVYDGAGPVGPYEPGSPCRCECHSAEGLPDWMRPQEGEALEEAMATERHIRELTAKLKRMVPVREPCRLIDFFPGNQPGDG